MPLVATHLLWHAADCPAPEKGEAADGLCWWCGSAWSGQMRPIKSCPNTFIDAVGRDCHNIDLTHLCAPCAWTLSDRAIMPPQVSGPRLDKALDGNHRSDLDTTGDAVAARVLVLRLNDGRVGVWDRPKRPAEKRWVAAREDLAAEPRDLDGCPLLAVYSHAEAARRLGAKFRNHIPFATAGGRWEMWTKADKAQIRETLLDPPAEPWTLTIGDGQKHCTILGVTSDGRDPLQQVYLDGAGVVSYRPADLASVLRSVETLIVSGASEDDIRADAYTPRGVPLMLAMREHRPTVEAHRGPRLELALWLRRSVADLKAADDIHPPGFEPATPNEVLTDDDPTHAAGDGGGPVQDAPMGRLPDPTEGRAGTAPGDAQLALFG